MFSYPRSSVATFSYHRTPITYLCFSEHVSPVICIISAFSMTWVAWGYHGIPPTIDMRLLLSPGRRARACCVSITTEPGRLALKGALCKKMHLNRCSVNVATQWGVSHAYLSMLSFNRTKRCAALFPISPAPYACILTFVRKWIHWDGMVMKLMFSRPPNNASIIEELLYPDRIVAPH